MAGKKKTAEAGTRTKVAASNATGRIDTLAAEETTKRSVAKTKPAAESKTAPEPTLKAPAATKGRTPRQGAPDTQRGMASEMPAAMKADKVVTAQERWRMIAENAYYRAERRGFVGGSPVDDWTEAEADIDAELARTNTVVER